MYRKRRGSSTTGRGNEIMTPSYGLLDMTVYGRQETWEDSPAGGRSTGEALASSVPTAVPPPNGPGWRRAAPMTLAPRTLHQTAAQRSRKSAHQHRRDAVCSVRGESTRGNLAQSVSLFILPHVVISWIVRWQSILLLTPSASILPARSPLRRA
jgi:hypothetical protein